jgi:hypothetical protein
MRVREKKLYDTHKRLNKDERPQKKSVKKFFENGASNNEDFEYCE